MNPKKIITALNDIDGQFLMEARENAAAPHRSKRRIVVLIAAIISLMAVTVTAFASENIAGWFKQYFTRRSDTSLTPGQIEFIEEHEQVISVTKTEGEVINHAFEVLFSNMMNNPQFRAVILNMLDAEEKAVSQEMYEAIKTGCIAFNRTHDTQLSFDRLEENDNNWTLFWEE